MVAYGSAGTLTAAAGSATAPTPSYPTVAAGDMMVLIVGVKPYTATITTPAGWTPTGTTTNGTTASGVDTGSVLIATYVKTALGSESGTLTLAVATGNSSWAQILNFTKTTSTNIWQTGTAVGSDTTSNTTFSVTFTTNPGITSGDYLALGAAGSTDAAQTWTSPTLTATGATVTAPTLVGQPLITTGNQSGGRTGYAPCTAGTASAAPVWAATLSTGTNALFSAAMVRLREQAAGALIGTLTDDFATADSVKWGGYGTGVSVSSGQLAIVPSALYPSVYTQSSYDLRESAASVQVAQTPNIGDGSTEVYLNVAPPGGSNTDQISVLWSNNVLTFRNKTGNVNSDTTVTYSATTHAWWRIRQASGTVYWDTSPDGSAWTNQRSVADGPYWTANIAVALVSGFWGTVPTPGTTLYDNFNVAPTSGLPDLVMAQRR